VVDSQRRSFIAVLPRRTEGAEGRCVCSFKRAAPEYNDGVERECVRGLKLTTKPKLRS
jgi:hypothetical protein